jgi:hypothetical protein
MWKQKLLLASLAAASIGLMPVPASADVGIYLDLAPPAPRYEVVPAPRAGYVWAPGYWSWRDGRHAWVAGHWIRERRGMYWHPDRWEQSEGRWAFKRGAWDRERFAENRYEHRSTRDRDGDGVPDRFDRAPDNPHRQ